MKNMEKAIQSINLLNAPYVASHIEVYYEFWKEKNRVKTKISEMEAKKHAETIISIADEFLEALLNSVEQQKANIGLGLKPYTKRELMRKIKERMATDKSSRKPHYHWLEEEVLNS